MAAIQRVVGKLTPLIHEGCSLLAGTSTGIFFHANQLRGGQASFASLALIYFNAALECFFSWFGVFYALRLLEQTAEESEAVLQGVEMDFLLSELCIFTASTERNQRMVPRSSKFSVKMFRRRVLRLRIGDFKTVNNGSALEYFHTAAGNMITYAFMVDSSSPSWIL